MTEKMTLQRDKPSGIGQISENTKQRTTESPVVNTVPLKYSSLPTPESIRHHGGISLDVMDRDLRNNVIQYRARFRQTCKLDWYLTKGIITDMMRDAGNQFGSYFFHAGKVPKTTVMYREFTSGNQGYDPYVEKTDAHKRLDDAMSILTSDEKDVLTEVCGFDNYAGAKRIKWLTTGLRALTVHFGYRTG